MVFEYEYDDKTQKMRINVLGSVFGNNIEDFPICMAATIDRLIELKRIPRLVLADIREYEYDFNDAKMLFEIANAIVRIQTERIISIRNIIPDRRCDKYLSGKYSLLISVLNDMKYDPVRAYKRLVHEVRHVNI